MINYISIGFFLVILIITLVYRMKTCNVSNCCNSETYPIKPIKSITQQDKEFLGKEVYQNVPLISYNYLVDYPDGPFSWGEWSWGGYKNNCKGDCSYSTTETSNRSPIQLDRNINNI